MIEDSYINESMKPHLARGKPNLRQEVGRLKPEDEGSILLGEALLKMRDGPRGRAPAREVPVPLIDADSYRDSVKLCEFSVDSVVKNDRNHEELPRRHREYGAINYLLKTWLSATTASLKNRDLQEEQPSLKFRFQSVILSGAEGWKNDEESDQYSVISIQWQLAVMQFGRLTVFQFGNILMRRKTTN